jgi:hypothetical protein
LIFALGRPPIREHYANHVSQQASLAAFSLPALVAILPRAELVVQTQATTDSPDGYTYSINIMLVPADLTMPDSSMKTIEVNAALN